MNDICGKPICPLAKLAAVALVLVSVSLPVRADEAPYRVEVQTDVMVPVRDGVKLATDIYLPTENGTALDQKLPTILMRTPYNKEGGKAYAQYSDVFKRRARDPTWQGAEGLRQAMLGLIDGPRFMDPKSNRTMFS